MKWSITFLSDRFNAFLLSQPGNRLIYYNEDDGNKNNNTNDPRNLKGIELQPKIKYKAVGR